MEVREGCRVRIKDRWATVNMIIGSRCYLDTEIVDAGGNVVDFCAKDDIEEIDWNDYLDILEEVLDE